MKDYIMPHERKTLFDQDGLKIGNIPEYVLLITGEIVGDYCIKKENPQCKKCFGTLKMVIPAVLLDNLFLFECQDCHERKYEPASAIDKMGDMG
jgi:hypothetical protein